MFRIGLIVVLAMLALLAGVGGGSPGALTAVKPLGPRPAAVWMCHPGSACLHMLVHQP